MQAVQVEVTCAGNADNGPCCFLPCDNDSAFQTWFGIVPYKAIRKKATRRREKVSKTVCRLQSTSTDERNIPCFC